MKAIANFHVGTKFMALTCNIGRLAFEVLMTAFV